jgi:hypothetical protein
MSRCDVTVCNRSAVVEVDFHGSGRWHGYCQFHGHTRDGALRWFGITLRSRAVGRRP